MFRYFSLQHGSLLTAVAIAIAAGAILWEPAMKWVGEREIQQINSRAEKEGWVGRYPVHYAPVDVKRIGD